VINTVLCNFAPFDTEFCIFNVGLISLRGDKIISNFLTIQDAAERTPLFEKQIISKENVIW